MGIRLLLSLSRGLAAVASRPVLSAGKMVGLWARWIDFACAAAF